MNGKKREKKQISFFFGLCITFITFVRHPREARKIFFFHCQFMNYSYTTHMIRLSNKTKKKMNVYCLKLGGFGIGYRREGIGDERKLYINIDSFVLHYYHQTI